MAVKQAPHKLTDSYHTHTSSNIWNSFIAFTSNSASQLRRRKLNRTEKLHFWFDILDLLESIENRLTTVRWYRNISSYTSSVSLCIFILVSVSNPRSNNRFSSENDSVTALSRYLWGLSSLEFSSPKTRFLLSFRFVKVTSEVRHWREIAEVSVYGGR